MDGLHHGDRMRVGGTSGVNNAGKRDRVQGKDEHKTVNDVNELLRVVQRKVTVKGSGGVVATVVVIVQRGKVWMSIQPPFTWDAIMAPGMVEELIRTLALAAEDAKKMVSGTRVSRGGSCPPGPPGHALDCLPKSLRSGLTISDRGLSLLLPLLNRSGHRKEVHRCRVCLRRTRQPIRLPGFRLLGSGMLLIGGTGMFR